MKTIKTAFNTIYIYEENNNLFAFKPSKDTEKEMLANKLARLLGVKTIRIEPFEINGEKGIKMEFKAESTLLAHYKLELSETQIKELKRIIFFDIWVGNKDRHTANIFVNGNLVAFDHEKLFNKGRARSFIKMDLGRKLNKNYVDIIEKVLDKKLTAKEVLMKIGFTEKDFIKIYKRDIEFIVKDKRLLEFLCSRTDFDKLEF